MPADSDYLAPVQMHAEIPNHDFFTVTLAQLLDMQSGVAFGKREVRGGHYFFSL